jgi:CDP-diacylglycerol--glycerol-3-phosphate 3-phosphatidyltransferase
VVKYDCDEVPHLNLANNLTLSRFIIIPIMVIIVYIDRFDQSVGFLNLTVEQFIISILFFLSALTDYFDGYIARKTNTTTVFGKFLDPIADKALVLTALTYLLYLGDMPYWVIVIIFVREFIVSGLRLVAAESNKVIAAGNLGKQKTAWTMFAIMFFLLNLQQFSVTISYFLIFIFVTLTVLSGIEYIYHHKTLFKNSFK